MAPAPRIMSKKAAVKRTEAEMLAMLRERYTEKAGNGDAWAFVTHVRNDAGFNAKRTADAIAMSLWPSRGLLLHGFEVKVSRSDWLRELRAPAKAEEFCAIVDRWWVVAADDSIVQPGELPELWGLLVARGKRLVCATEARPLSPGPAPIARGFLASLLRSACRVSEADPAAVVEAREIAREEERARWESRVESLEHVLEDHRERERGFLLAAGVGYGWRANEELARALRIVLAGERDTKNAEQNLARLRDEAQRVAAYVDGRLKAYATGEHFL